MSLRLVRYIVAIRLILCFPDIGTESGATLATPLTGNSIHVSSKPAAKYCNDGSIYDHTVQMCFQIDSTDFVNPVFDPCPFGSTLKGHLCVGDIFSDEEFRCPVLYTANAFGVCMKPTIYYPKGVLCPHGFDSKVVDQKNLHVCIKEFWQEPTIGTLHTIPLREQLQLSIQNSTRGQDTALFVSYPSPAVNLVPKETSLECPPGSELVVKKIGGIMSCRIRVVVYPDPRTCIDGYFYSPSLGGCLQIKARRALLSCPYPNAKLGEGFGDWKTPKFTEHEYNKCVAHEVAASNPKCPPGYHLEGYKVQQCYRKIYTPFTYSCANLDGYVFRFDNDTNTGMCDYASDEYAWVEGPSLEARRAELDTKRIIFRQTPFDYVDAYEVGEEMKKLNRLHGA